MLRSYALGICILFVITPALALITTDIVGGFLAPLLICALGVAAAVRIIGRVEHEAERARPPVSRREAIRAICEDYDDDRLTDRPTSGGFYR